MSRRALSVGAALVALAAAMPAGAAPKKDAGSPVLLAARSKTAHCTVAALPDRRCSPGAYASKLTQKVVCAKGFSTADYRGVPTSEKADVEREYGLAVKPYGKTLEIDHIVSLELGGSNDIANLFPEKRNAAPGFPAKDKLENRLHDVVCTEHAMTLRQAQRAIAQDWVKLYRKVFGLAP
jgi:hypothetical protein